MTSKGKLAERIIIRLTGGIITRDQKKKYDERVIALDIEDKYSYFAKLALYDNLKNGDDNVPEEFLTSYIVDVQTDSVRGKKYITLPCSYITLPYGKGLYSISPTQGENALFIPAPSSYEFMFSGLDAGDLDCEIPYMVEGKNVYFGKNFKGQHQYTSLLVKLVASIGALDMDDEFNLPPEVEDQIIDSIVERYSQMRPVDIVNDDNPND